MSVSSDPLGAQMVFTACACRPRSESRPTRSDIYGKQMLIGGFQTKYMPWNRRISNSDGLCGQCTWARCALTHALSQALKLLRRGHTSTVQA
jgi:hypothetical protein